MKNMIWNILTSLVNIGGIGSQSPRVKKTYTRRLMMLVVSGLLFVVGVGLFIIYFFTLNMMAGGPSVFLIASGFFLFKYYRAKGGDIAIEHIGEVSKKQVNSMNLYPGKVVFEDVYEPEGYPWGCINDKKKYFVNEWDEMIKKLVPFVLPDQQYYDPTVFAERPLELPAHQKIFARKPKLLDKIKTGLLVVAIGIVWLLILTTTG